MKKIFAVVVLAILSFNAQADRASCVNDRVDVMIDAIMQAGVRGGDTPAQIAAARAKFVPTLKAVYGSFYDMGQSMKAGNLPMDDGQATRRDIRSRLELESWAGMLNEAEKTKIADAMAGLFEDGYAGK